MTANAATGDDVRLRQPFRDRGGGRARCRKGRNSPQRPAFGLYAEQLSGTAFTAPRAENRRSWLYRMRPSAAHPPYRALRGRARCSRRARPTRRCRPTGCAGIRSPCPSRADRLRRRPGHDDGQSRSRPSLEGVAVHVYRANRRHGGPLFLRRRRRAADHPASRAGSTSAPRWAGSTIAPGEVALIPRGVRFRVLLPDGEARGYVAENHGALFRLPELGPIGSNGLANPRDFLTPGGRLRGSRRARSS